LKSITIDALFASTVLYGFDSGRNGKEQSVFFFYLDNEIDFNKMRVRFYTVLKEGGMKK